MSERFGNPFSWANPLRAPSASVQPSLVQVPHCRVLKSAQSIPDATATAVIFSTVTYTFGNMVDIATNPTRITIRKQGLYMVIGTMDWPTGGTAGNSIVATIRLNNSSPVQTLTVPYPSSTAGLDHQIVATGRFVPGDYLELVVTQNNLNGGANFTLSTGFFEACFLSSY